MEEKREAALCIVLIVPLSSIYCPLLKYVFLNFDDLSHCLLCSIVVMVVVKDSRGGCRKLFISVIGLFLKDKLCFGRCKHYN